MHSESLESNQEARNFPFVAITRYSCAKRVPRFWNASLECPVNDTDYCVHRSRIFSLLENCSARQEILISPGGKILHGFFCHYSVRKYVCVRRLTNSRCLQFHFHRFGLRRPITEPLLRFTADRNQRVRAGNIGGFCAANNANLKQYYRPEIATNFVFKRNSPIPETPTSWWRDADYSVIWKTLVIGCQLEELFGKLFSLWFSRLIALARNCPGRNLFSKLFGIEKTR